MHDGKDVCAYNVVPWYLVDQRIPGLLATGPGAPPIADPTPEQKKSEVANKAKEDEEEAKLQALMQAKEKEMEELKKLLADKARKP